MYPDRALPEAWEGASSGLSLTLTFCMMVRAGVAGSHVQPVLEDISLLRKSSVTAGTGSLTLGFRRSGPVAQLARAHP
jgi:hypothetical protein